MPTQGVLVTGAGGLVGRAVVARLLADGREVVAADLDTPANRAWVAGQESSSGGGSVRAVWTDLTDADAVRRLLAAEEPAAVVHLAAVIPPATYAHRDLARRVNVEGTRHLVSALAALDAPPRLVHASSIAVHGPRNPHTHPDPLRADTPLAPGDTYGIHKAEAERLVRDSDLDWVVLRLGGVLATDLRSGQDADASWFGALLPSDGRLQTVDVRDVARAFAAATTADVLGEVHMVGGDDTHRQLQGEVPRSLTAAMGLEGAVPDGLPGDPSDDAAWFATDWMDTAASQQALDFQRVSWPELLDEIRRDTGWKRYLLRLAAPLVHELQRRRHPYRDRVGPYADPWGAIARRWGDPHQG